ncbi:MAG: fumarylacetoacetate hydrolase family protein [Elusimicrobia bacterium]|nr:fumarylacetoacetate hydrolase family protein [Elusimicrobiota bacterium]
MRELADRLWRARLEARGCEPPTRSHPRLDISDAYRISRLNFQRRLERGAKLVGRKIGLTSEAVQRQIGVDQPDFGYLTSDMSLENGEALGAGELIQAKVEGEAVFVLGRELKGPGVDREDVMRAADHIRACIEVIDSRVKDWRIKIQDTIADNASSAYFALGAERIKPGSVDLRRCRMKLWKNGSLASEGSGSACLGDPARAVAWLANALAVWGEGLKPGDIVLSGAFGPVVPFSRGDECRVEIEGLGRVDWRYV